MNKENFQITVSAICMTGIAILLLLLILSGRGEHKPKTKTFVIHQINDVSGQKNKYTVKDSSGKYWRLEVFRMYNVGDTVLILEN
jgi:hypothetical protein